MVTDSSETPPSDFMFKAAMLQNGFFLTPSRAVSILERIENIAAVSF